MPKKKVKTKGSWFNVIACIAIFIFTLIMQISYMDAFLQKSKLTKNTEILGFGIILLHTIIFLGILTLGTIFNLISKIGTDFFGEIYVKFPFLIKIDNFLDWALWWLIFLMGIGGFLLNVIVVELVL